MFQRTVARSFSPLRSRADQRFAMTPANPPALIMNLLLIALLPVKSLCGGNQRLLAGYRASRCWRRAVTLISIHILAARGGG
jgi:hypothetical protein